MKKVVILLLLCLFAGCTRTVYVSVPEVRVDSIVHTEFTYLRDTIYQRETVIQKGDTVYVTKYKYVGKESSNDKTDTIIQRDTIPVPVPYPVEKEVIKYRMSGYGILGWVLLILGVSAIVYKRIKNIKDYIRSHTL